MPIAEFFYNAMILKDKSTVEILKNFTVLFQGTLRLRKVKANKVLCHSHNPLIVLCLGLKKYFMYKLQASYFIREIKNSSIHSNVSLNVQMNLPLCSCSGLGCLANW